MIYGSTKGEKQIWRYRWRKRRPNPYRLTKCHIQTTEMSLNTHIGKNGTIVPQGIGRDDKKQTIWCPYCKIPQFEDVFLLITRQDNQD